MFEYVQKQTSVQDGLTGTKKSAGSATVDLSSGASQANSSSKSAASATNSNSSSASQGTSDDMPESPEGIMSSHKKSVT